jgi:hypothetical protein
VTCLGPSAGFDPTANTSGFIIWLNHTGIMIDPPINSTVAGGFQRQSQADRLHHPDPLPRGSRRRTLQKILEEGKVTVYSTKTVMKSFCRSTPLSPGSR